MRNLKGKVVVITGAAGGIGKQTALAFAAKGCALAICDLDLPALEVTATECEAIGARVTTHRVDVSSQTEMLAFADSVDQAHGVCHVVVNNAGVTVMAKFEDHTIEDFEWLVGVNFWGVVYGCKFFLPLLKRAGEGHIVNISSAFGIIAPPKQTSYVATKFAVRGFSESLRSELAEHGIGVTSVHPGTIQTNIVRDARIPAGKSTDLRENTQRIFDRLGTSADVVAKRIVRAVESNSPRALVTAETYLADALMRLAPESTAGLVARIVRRLDR